MTEIDFASYIGKTSGEGTVVIERAPVTQFATALLDTSPEYRDAGAAEEAGFGGIPVPPTYGFVAPNWGRWEELQPPASGEIEPMTAVMGGLMANGGLILHGEQSFTYHRPVVTGDRLNYRGVVKDIYQKESGSSTMTFMVIETTYSDESGAPALTSTMNLIHRS
jgi:acyl dehydratase